jgi:hypothetical protein
MWSDDDLLRLLSVITQQGDGPKICIRLCSLKIPPSPYSKEPLKKIIIDIKLVVMSTIFHCTKICLPKCNGSRVVTKGQYLHFEIQPPAMFISLVSRKNGLIKIVQPLNNCQHTKFHGPTLSGASLLLPHSHLRHIQRSIQENNYSAKLVGMSVIFHCVKLRMCKFKSS